MRLTDVITVCDPLIATASPAYADGALPSQRAITMVGKTLGHYEILEPLGAGGMREVYRVPDTVACGNLAVEARIHNATAMA